MAVLFVLSLLLTIYPVLSNYLGEKNRSLVQSEYTKAVQSMDGNSIDEELNKAAEYNATLTPGATEHAAFSREALADAEEEYYGLLNIRGDGIMGYVEVPKLNIDLPIYHGTEDNVLAKGVGHLLGSSLPVGGDGTHSVLTGHSGLAGQKMFSDLDQLKEGDLFYIHILDETLAYEVDAINVVLPENTSNLGIDYMKDYCTLITCTPYSVNTHRLLVRGHRIAYEEAVQLMEEDAFMEDEVISSWSDQYVLGMMVGVSFLIVILLILTVRHIQREEEKYEDEA